MEFIGAEKCVVQADERNIAHSEKLAGEKIRHNRIVSFELPSRERENYSNSRRAARSTDYERRSHSEGTIYIQSSCPLRSNREMLGREIS